MHFTAQVLIGTTASCPRVLYQLYLAPDAAGCNEGVPVCSGGCHIDKVLAPQRRPGHNAIPLPLCAMGTAGVVGHPLASDGLSSTQQEAQYALQGTWR